MKPHPSHVKSRVFRSFHELAPSELERTCGGIVEAALAYLGGAALDAVAGATIGWAGGHIVKGFKRGYENAEKRRAGT